MTTTAERQMELTLPMVPDIEIAEDTLKSIERQLLERSAEREIPLQAVTLNVGVLYVFAMLSLGVYGVMMAGWASSNNYALLGGQRAAALMISSEIAIGASIVGVIMIYGSLNMQDIVRGQGHLLFGWLPAWGIVTQPLGFVIFLLAFVPLVFGGTVYRMIEKIMTAKLVLVLGYLLFLGIFYVSGKTWVEVFAGFLFLGQDSSGAWSCRFLPEGAKPDWSLLAAFANAVFGTLLAWVLARYDFPGRRFIDALVDFPFALPTAVAGITLTTLYAPNVWLGAPLERYGIKVAFTPLGITIALVFIGLPFVVRTLQPVIEDLDVEMPLPVVATGGLADARERLGEDVVERLAVGEALLELRGLGPELVVGEVLDLHPEHEHHGVQELRQAGTAAGFGVHPRGLAVVHQGQVVAQVPAGVQDQRLGGRAGGQVPGQLAGDVVEPAQAVGSAHPHHAPVAPVDPGAGALHGAGFVGGVAVVRGDVGVGAVGAHGAGCDQQRRSHTSEVIRPVEGAESTPFDLGIQVSKKHLPHPRRRTYLRRHAGKEVVREMIDSRTGEVAVR